MVKVRDIARLVSGEEIVNLQFSSPRYGAHAHSGARGARKEGNAKRSGVALCSISPGTYPEPEERVFNAFAASGFRVGDHPRLWLGLRCGGRRLKLSAVRAAERRQGIAHGGEPWDERLG